MPSYTRKVQIPGKTSQELYDKVASDIDGFLSKGPFGQYEIERIPEKKEVKVKSSMFSATLTCQDSQMELHAQLSLLAAPFRSKVDEGINKWLAKAFQLPYVG